MCGLCGRRPPRHNRATCDVCAGKVAERTGTLHIVYPRCVETDGPGWSKTDIAWVAGLLEGEGYFAIKTTGHYRRPHVQLRMTDKDVVEKFAALVGLKIQSMGGERENRRTIWNCTVAGWHAVDLCRVGRDHMGVGRQTKLDEF